MHKGMNEKEYENRIRELAFTFFAGPAVILIGMAGTGAIIDGLLKASNTFAYLFSAVGGIPSVGFYFYREWKRFVNKEVPEKEVIENQKKILKILNEIKVGLIK